MSFWLEKFGQNQVFGMATLAEYKTRNIFWTFLLSAYKALLSFKAHFRTN